MASRSNAPGLLGTVPVRENPAETFNFFWNPYENPDPDKILALFLNIISFCTFDGLMHLHIAAWHFSSEPTSNYIWNLTFCSFYCQKTNIKDVLLSVKSVTFCKKIFFVKSVFPEV